MSWQCKAISALIAGISAATIVAASAGGSSVTKQRIALEGTVRLATGKGTFTLIPLTPGSLKRDSGPLTGRAGVKPLVKENGQRVNLINATNTYFGKNGTFGDRQRIESVPVHGFWVVHGSWRFEAGTGTYVGVSGGGGFAAVGPISSGVLYLREEGYITKR